MGSPPRTPPASGLRCPARRIEPRRSQARCHALVEVTELALRDGHQSLLATRMATGRHGPGLRGHRPGRLLERRMLGRGHLRLLHPLPQRRPVGAAAHVPQADAQLPAADAAARPEPAGLPPLRGHASSTASWTSRPRTAWTSSASSTRSTTSATCAARSTPSAAPASTPRGPSATPSRPLHTVEKFVEMAQRLKEMGCDSICIKDMAALLQAAAGLRHRARASRRRAARTRWSTSTSTRPPASRWSA